MERSKKVEVGSFLITLFCLNLETGERYHKNKGKINPFDSPSFVDEMLNQVQHDNGGEFGVTLNHGLMKIRLVSGSNGSLESPTDYFLGFTISP